MSLVNIGGNRIRHSINRHRVYAVLAYKGSGVVRLVKNLSKQGLLIDIRAGSKAKSLIIMDNHSAYLSAHSPVILVERLNSNPLGVLHLKGPKKLKGVQNDEQRSVANA